MQEIKSNKDLTRAMVDVKKGRSIAIRLTKKHAKENGISWDHFENTARILRLKVIPGGYGHAVTK